MLADDDIIMSTHTLNEAFRIFGTFNMTLAQPTLCRHPQVGVSHGVVLQNQSNLIRYPDPQVGRGDYWEKGGGAGWREEDQRG